MFPDRTHAARLLAERLIDLRGTHPLILAIPRGAAPMGRILADTLEGELDVVLVRKLGAPGNPEYAIGAVDESGTVLINPEAGFSADDPYVRAEAERQLHTIRKRRQAYTPSRGSIDPAGRTVVVVDDGVATGSTMIAALRAIRARKPETLVVAVGVAPPETVKHLQREADEVVCLEAPRFFSDVGQFFRDFGQVEDSEVLAALKG